MQRIGSDTTWGKSRASSLPDAVPNFVRQELDSRSAHRQPKLGRTCEEQMRRKPRSRWGRLRHRHLRKLTVCSNPPQSRTVTIMRNKETVLVTGASQGIGAAVVQIFLDRGYNVVATSLRASSAGFAPS